MGFALRRAAELAQAKTSLKEKLGDEWDAETAKAPSAADPAGLTVDESLILTDERRRALRLRQSKQYQKPVAGKKQNGNRSTGEFHFDRPLLNQK